MKQFITAAALLAASTALASAAVVTIAEGLPTSVTTINNSDTSGTLGASDANGNSIAPTSASITTLVSKTSDATAGWYAASGAFTVNSSFPVSVSADAVSITCPWAASWRGQFIADIIDLSSWDYSLGDLSDLTVSLGLTGAGTQAYYSVWLLDSSDSVTQIANTKIDLSAYTDGTEVTITDTNTYTSSSDASKLVVVASTGPGGGSASVGITSLSVTGTTSSIPEPSSFGLLAGVGALALVAARRRRSRKA